MYRIHPLRYDYSTTPHPVCKMKHPIRPLRHTVSLRRSPSRPPLRPLPLYSPLSHSLYFSRGTLHSLISVDDDRHVLCYTLRCSHLRTTLTGCPTLLTDSAQFDAHSSPRSTLALRHSAVSSLDASESLPLHTPQLHRLRSLRSTLHVLIRSTTFDAFDWEPSVTTLWELTASSMLFGC